jgi:amidase
VAPSGIDRRQFLQATLALGAAACVETKPVSVPNRAAGAAEPSFDLEEMTVAELQRGMQEGRWTAEGLTATYLARIERLDPKLAAVIETNPDARGVARQLDEERKAGRMRGPLHGIPVLVKDNLDTAGKMETTAGSLALVGSRRLRDSFVVQRLRAAGAVLLGKTNLSEWANIRSSHSSSGWSGRGGQCRNPYVLDRTPCGSSSGSAVAVSANLCAVAIGTETDGSIVCPSTMCGIVGLKPTIGLVSRTGIVPISHSQDTAGPMARSVTDAAILLGAIAGEDPLDPVTSTGRGQAPADYTRFLDPHGLRGARIGIVREKLMGYSDAADRVAQAAIEVMRDAGAVIVDPANVPHVGDYDDAELTVLLYELKADLNRYLAGLDATPVRTLSELIAFNRAHADRELRWFGQDLFEQAEVKGPLTDKPYLDARAKCVRLSREEGIDAVMREHQLDALFAPTSHPAWAIDLVNGDHALGSASTPPAVAGYPSITVPAGDDFGLPIGVSFFGRPFSEPLLLKLAFAFEQATHARKPPRLLPTLEA